MCIFFLETAPSARGSARSHFPRLTFSFTMQVDLSFLYSAQVDKGQFKNRTKNKEIDCKLFISLSFYASNLHTGTKLLF